MKLTVPAEIKFETLIEALCRSSKFVEPTEYTRFDLDRLARAIAFLNQKLSEHEAQSTGKAGEVRPVTSKN